MASPVSRSEALKKLKQTRLSSPVADEGSCSHQATSDVAVATRPPPAAAPPRTAQVLAWQCGICHAECVPIRTESRCLCGHRMKEHDKPGENDHGRCKAARCGCPSFFFIMAEGSWVLRCRCKHKHIEHDPLSATHSCKKCPCKLFDSPFVCNCNHSWSDHKQLLVTRQVRTIEDMMAAAALGQEVPELNPVPEMNVVKRGLDA